MIEAIKNIGNPLTIIALFAGLAEVSGTAVLPFLPDALQEIFVWFVVGFPILLVTLFFLTLNFNHRVLYAPMDYRDDKSFLAASRIAESNIDDESSRGIEIQVIDGGEF